MVLPHLGQRLQSQADRCDRDTSHWRNASPRSIMFTGLVTSSACFATTEWSLGPPLSVAPVATLHQHKLEPSRLRRRTPKIQSSEVVKGRHPRALIPGVTVPTIGF